MKKVLAIVGAALLLSTSVAQAVEVYADSGTRVLVFGIPKNGVCVAGSNGNKVCGANVPLADTVITADGMIEVNLTNAQKRGLSKICVKIYGSLDDPKCGAPNSSELRLA